MKALANQALYNLIRNYMHALGTSRTTVVALKSYIDAIQRLNCTTADFRSMLEELNSVIKDTEPKVIPLVRAHTELNRVFKVLVLKHDFMRTKALVDDLEHNQVDHILIPEYNLSHYLRSAHKLFIGAVSVTSDNQAVTGIGTANVVSLCNWYHVPVYLFAESIKFSHESLADQLIYYEEQDKTEADFKFHMKTFSHDFIHLAMVDHLITEMGEIDRPAG